MRWLTDIFRNATFREKLAHSGILIGFILLGSTIYSNTFDVPFVFDDMLNIIDNPFIRKAVDLKNLWRYDPSRFLTHFTFALNFQFGRFEVYGYHLVNLGVHLLTVIASYLFLGVILNDPANLSPAIYARRRWVMAVAALLFLCHPIQTQAVTYVSQRSTPLAAFCYLSSLVAYIHFRRNGGWKIYTLALVFAFLGLFTKPIIVTLPLAMALCEVMFISRGIPRQKRVWLGLLPFFLMALAVPALLILWRDQAFAVSNYLTITRESGKYSRGEYFLTELNVIMTYIRLLFLPINQKLDYDYPIAKSFFDFPVWISFLVISGIFYAAVRSIRTHRLISFGILWMFVTLSLESSVFPISDVIFEHRLYLPMVGFSLLIAYGLVLAAGKKPRQLIAVSSLIILICCGLTYRRNGQWRDALGFYQDMAERFPNKSRILNNLGNYYAEKKDWEMALKSYEQTIAISPDAMGTYNNIANIYGEQGRYPEAITVLEYIIAHDPSFAAAYYNLGIIYSSSQYKEYDKAIANFSRTLELTPGFAPAMVGIANVYGTLNDPDKARFYLEQARDMNPGLALAYEDLGHLYLAQSQYELAAQYYLEAIRRDPGVAVVHNNLGNIYAMHGQDDLALAEYHKAIKCDTAFAGSYKNLADLLKKNGKFPEAKPYYEKALELFQKQNDGLMIEQIQQQLNSPS